MTIRNAILFDGSKASKILRAQWGQKGALQPLLTGMVLLENDRTGTRQFRALWEAAFPSRPRLPKEPLADREGRGSLRFWDVFG